MVPAAGAGQGRPGAPMALARAGQGGGSHRALTQADSAGRVALASVDLSQGQRRDGDPAGSSGQMREGLRESPEYCGENGGGGAHDAAPLSRFPWVFCSTNSQSTRLDTGQAWGVAAASPGRGGGLVTPAPRCQPRGSASVYPLCAGGGDPPQRAPEAPVCGRLPQHLQVLGIRISRVAPAQPGLQAPCLGVAGHTGLPSRALELGGPPCPLSSHAEGGVWPGSGSAAGGTSQPLPCAARALPSWPCFPHSALARAAPGSSTLAQGCSATRDAWLRRGLTVGPRHARVSLLGDGPWARGGAEDRGEGLCSPTPPARTAVRSRLAARSHRALCSPPARN